MTPDRWQQISSLYQAALEREVNEREAFLKQVCSGDEELRREVEDLLVHHQVAAKFMAAPALDVAAKVLARTQDHRLVGKQLGPYKVLSLLGAGGMGEVYLAQDTRLERQVALKVLPPEVTQDPDRLKRFVREAKAASALNHPNIITIHDIGSEGGIDFIVMEYVQGKTLDQRIAPKTMRLNEALTLALQMADALAKAHSAGIVHRDLKPTNVMVTDDGLVKVLDFGLAKLTEVGSAEGETLSVESNTGEGLIIGTVSYMSPEQVEGKKIDARSDIFSFGAVLYEIATGQKAFQGDSKISTLMAVLKQEPKPAGQVVPGLPKDLEKIIHRCLRKDPERRFPHMTDIKAALQELKDGSHTVTGTPADARTTQRAWVWAGGALVVVAIAVTGWLFHEGIKKPPPAPEVVPLTSYPGFEVCPSFSPDGNQVVFSWNGEKLDNYDIYVQMIGSPTPVRLTTDPADDYYPAFSPDGRSIGFVRQWKGHTAFIVIPAIGGTERLVADLPKTVNIFAWLPDGKWVVIDGLALLSTESGETRPLTFPPPGSFPDNSPAISPDGRAIAFTRQGRISEICLLDLTEDLKPKGEPRRLTSSKGLLFGSAWNANGREIIFSSLQFGNTHLWRISPSGTREPEELTFAGESAYLPAISRSGNRLVYEQRMYDSNIWRLSLSGPGIASGSPSRLIASTRVDGDPQYSPDGKRIAFLSSRSGPWGIWVSDADGSHVAELISRVGTRCEFPSWSPDGQRIAFTLGSGEDTDIYLISANGGKPIRLTTDPADDAAPSCSRDGKWVYFASDRTGRFEVWKVSAAGGEAVQVTRNGGYAAFESPDGKFIYYSQVEGSAGLWKMPVSGGPESRALPSLSSWRTFSLVNEGIYFIPEVGFDRKSYIQFLSFATGKVKTVAPLSRESAGGLSVSPNCRSVLYSQFDTYGSDLMLVENFR